MSQQNICKSFPIAVKANFHKVNGLKQNKFMASLFLQRQKEQWLPEARCGKNRELLLNDTISTWADEKVLEADGDDSCTTM